MTLNGVLSWTLRLIVRTVKLSTLPRICVYLKTAGPLNPRVWTTASLLRYRMVLSRTVRLMTWKRRLRWMNGTLRTLLVLRSARLKVTVQGRLSAKRQVRRLMRLIFLFSCRRRPARLSWRRLARTLRARMLLRKLCRPCLRKCRRLKLTRMSSTRCPICLVAQPSDRNLHSLLNAGGFLDELTRRFFSHALACYLCVMVAICRTKWLRNVGMPILSVIRARPLGLRI